MAFVIIIVSFVILYGVIYKAVKDAINDSVLGKRVSTENMIQKPVTNEDIERELQQTMKMDKSE